MLNLLQPIALLNSNSGSAHRVRVILPTRLNPVTERILTVRFHRTESQHGARRPGDLGHVAA